MTDDTMATKISEQTGFKTPCYYRHASGIECLEISKFLSCALGQAFQYVWRSDNKHDNPIEDLEKALHWVSVEKDIDSHDYSAIGKDVGSRLLSLISKVNAKEKDKTKAKALFCLVGANCAGFERDLHLNHAINTIKMMIDERADIGI